MTASATASAAAASAPSGDISADSRSRGRGTCAASVSQAVTTTLLAGSTWATRVTLLSPVRLWLTSHLRGVLARLLVLGGLALLRRLGRRELGLVLDDLPVGDRGGGKRGSKGGSKGD
eukprot:scaffold62144_cov27-Phaeocystis_antarctica.AAC.1